MTEMKTLDVEIVSSGDSTLAPSGLVELRLIDITKADARSISLAELRLRCGGLMPINLPLTFDTSLIAPGRSYALAARIEIDGQLRYINTSRHSIDPATASGTQRVTVDPVASGSGPLFSDNLAD